MLIVALKGIVGRFLFQDKAEVSLLLSIVFSHIENDDGLPQSSCRYIPRLAGEIAQTRDHMDQFEVRCFHSIPFNFGM